MGNTVAVCRGPPPVTETVLAALPVLETLVLQLPVGTPRCSWLAMGTLQMAPATCPECESGADQGAAGREQFMYRPQCVLSACRQLCTLQNPSLCGGFAVVTNSPAVDQTALVCCHVPVLVLYCVVHSCAVLVVYPEPPDNGHTRSHTLTVSAKSCNANGVQTRLTCASA